MVLEVRLGRDGTASAQKGHWRMDALYIPDHHANEIRVWRHDDGLDHEVTDRNVEIIEAKPNWNTDVIGQAVAGAALVGHAFPQHGLVTKVVVVDGGPDPTLETVCDNLGIRWFRLTADPDT